jgi:DNA-binding response OmpR family regulator
MNKEKEKKILLVDDEMDVLDIYHDKFVLRGYNVIKTTKGLEAVRLAKKHLPDVVLLDLIMPDLDGYKILKTLKTNTVTKSIPVIVLTNIGHSDGIEKGILNGADDYLVKVNFAPAEVVEKVDRFLGEYEASNL